MTSEKPHHHYPHLDHLRPAFGADTSGCEAEAFARFFGTPKFLIGQTLILLAQTRQADRDRALSDANTSHREHLADAALQRLEIADAELQSLQELLERNTELTRQLERLTAQIHSKVVAGSAD